MKKPELDIEEKVINRFIVKGKRERFLSFIKRESTRQKFIKDLSHINFLENDLFDEVGANEHEIIKNRIAKIGDLKNCYIISENTRIDTKRLDIELAMAETIGADMGTILVFGDADIVYVEAEGFKNRWISKYPLKNK